MSTKQNSLRKPIQRCFMLIVLSPLLLLCGCTPGRHLCTVMFSNLIILSAMSGAIIILLYKLRHECKKYLIAVVIITVCISGFYLMWLNSIYLFIENSKANISSFAPYVEDYIGHFYNAQNSSNKINMLREPLIIIDVNSRTIHPLFKQLPLKLAAENPHDIATIIFIKKDLERHFWYDAFLRKSNERLAGFKSIWSVTAIDKRSNSIIFSKNYISLPHESVEAKSSVDSEIIYDQSGTPGLPGFSKEREIYVDILNFCNYSIYSPWPFVRHRD